jgi:uncharacterized protein
VHEVRKVLIAGVSTRAAAESAGRAGFAVTAIDAYGDLDQPSSAKVLSLPNKFTARAAALAAQSVDGDAVVYLSSFENHPNAIAMLAEGRELWGNSPAVVGRVRDPLLLAETLRKRGFAAPRVYVGSGFSPTVTDNVRLKPDPTIADRLKPDPTIADTSTDDIRVWLVKPIASGGGQRIWRWDGAASLPRRCYLQEFVEGPSGSIVFVAAGGRAVPFGISGQLVGEEAFGAEGFQYCGSILAAAGDPQFPHDEALVEQASALAGAVTEEFGLIGVNGIDFVARAGIPYAIELNPRWCASMELVERAYGLSIFAAHAAACSEGLLPEFDLVRARRHHGAVGKGVVYARQDVTVGETRTWLTKDENIRDIPQPGSRIPRGAPVCTILADGADGLTCHDALVQRAGRVYAQLEAWSA